MFEFSTLLAAASETLGQIMQPVNLLAIVGGFIGGLFIGLLPALGPSTLLVMLLPLVFKMEPVTAMCLFAAVMGSATQGGAVTSILLGIPGTGSNVATVFDGYPMCKKGQAARAIATAQVCSAFGGLFGVICLVLLLPVVVMLLMSFAAPEFFMLIMAGLVCIVIAARGNMLKGLASAAIGILFSFIGFNSITADIRFTAGILYLWDGIELIPVIIGIFALSEVMMLTLRGGTVAETKETVKGTWSHTLEGFREVLKHKLLWLRSSIIGVIIGIIPGIGGSVASLLSYTAAMQTSKHPENFGKGEIEGVIGPEAANNAKEGGAVLPTLAFGLPGSVEMTVWLAAFTILGVEVGPVLFLQKSGLVVAMTIIFVLAIANVVSSAVVLLLSRQLSRVAYINYYYLVPVIVTACLVGSFATRSEILDVVMAVLFGFFGYALRKAGFPIVTFIIGFILGAKAEHGFLQALMISWGSYSIFVTRPISLALLIIVIFLLALPFIRKRGSQKRSQRI